MSHVRGDPSNGGTAYPEFFRKRVLHAVDSSDLRTVAQRVAAAAQKYEVSPRTVFRWLRLRKNVKNLERKPVPGRHAVITGVLDALLLLLIGKLLVSFLHAMCLHVRFWALILCRV